MPKKVKVRRLLELYEKVDEKVEEPQWKPLQQEPQVQATGGRIKEPPRRNAAKGALPNFKKKKDIHVNVNANNIRLVL